MTAAKFREGMVVLTLAQSKLRDQVNGLVERMNSRLVVSDPSFKKIAELLPKAAEQMTAAEKKLQAPEPRRRAAAREHGAAVPAAGRRGIRAAGADRPPGRRRWRRRRRGIDRERSGRLVQDGNGQDGESVRDQLAGLDAAAGSADRRARGKTEGARAPAGAGDRTPAPYGGGPVGRQQRRRSAARARRAGRRSGAPAREAVARSAAPGSRRHRAPAAQRRRCDAPRRGEGRSVGGRPGRRGRRSAA